MSAIVETVTVSLDDGEVRLDRFLRRRHPHLTQGQIEKLLRTGQIRVDGARAKANDRLGPGQTVRIPPLPEAKPREPTLKIRPEDQDFVQDLVIFKDDDTIVLNKPSGLPTQGGTGVTRHVDGLLEGLRFGSEERPKLVHRLDKDTSGALLIARTPRAAAFYSKAFKSRDTQKVYWAVVLGTPRPDVGEIRGWMKKASGPIDADREMVRRAAHGDKEALFAITDYAVISEAGTKASWVGLKPVTGRTHQLRFHMAEAGTAILGDRKYTCALQVPLGLAEGLHLHARGLDVPHPDGGRVRIVAPLSPHMRQTFDALGFDEREQKDPFKLFFAAERGDR